jgi:erythromycin esterase
VFALTRYATAWASVFLVASALTFLACGQISTSVSQNSSSHADILAEASTWLRSAAVPFNQVDPADTLDDLEPLRQIVGSARVVSLGEATHGTREFHQTRHRILRFLVERMGFTAFALEGQWAEANRLDQYVRTGKGDPAALLSGLYFWVSNTDETLQMIQWMRRYNAAGGNVGFYGFDMQFPGMPIDNITKFVAAVDPKASAEFSQHLECLARYANDASGQFPTPGYADQPDTYRSACLQDLHWIQDTLTARQATYVRASALVYWARAVQSARVAIQYEEMTSQRRERDLAMADNAKWLVDQLPSSGKILLFAHDLHVCTPGKATMGDTLRQVFGQTMVVMGSLFAQGSFNAKGVSGLSLTPVGQPTIAAPRYDAYEEFFQASQMPRFFLDLRNRSTRTGTPAWVFGPKNVLYVGAVYNEHMMDSYYYAARLPNEYDAIIFIDESSPAILLPFVYPKAF